MVNLSLYNIKEYIYELKYTWYHICISLHKNVSMHLMLFISQLKLIMT